MNKNSVLEIVLTKNFLPGCPSAYSLFLFSSALRGQFEIRFISYAVLADYVDEFTNFALEHPRFSGFSLETHIGFMVSGLNGIAALWDRFTHALLFSDRSGSSVVSGYRTTWDTTSSSTSAYPY